MPDFERLLRDLELDMARDKARRERIRATHRALDKKYWLVLLVVTLVIGGITLIEIIATTR